MIYGELELEYLQRIQQHCPGQATRIQSLPIQENFASCVLEYVVQLIEEEQDLPSNILLTFVGLLGRSEGDKYISILLRAQKGEFGGLDTDFVTQAISRAITISNTEVVWQYFATLSPSVYLAWLLAKMALLNPNLTEPSYQLFVAARSSDPQLEMLVPQWTKRCLDKEVRRGFVLFNKIQKTES